MPRLGSGFAVGLLLCAGSGCSGNRGTGGGGDEDAGVMPDGGPGLDAAAPLRDAGGEACEGTDDDGDGSVDEGCECPIAGEERACPGEPAACGERIQRCVNAGEFGTAWSTCELRTPPGGCVDAGPADAGSSEPDASFPPGACGRPGGTADPRDRCWVAATIDGVDPACPTAGSWKRFDPYQGLWIGIIECSSPMGFRFYLMDPAFGDWRPATDGAGHGQDFCELVDPTFTIPDEDDITSGGCEPCMTGRSIYSRGPIYARHRFGECFMEETAVMDWPWHTSVIYCGMRGADLEAIGTTCRAAP